jgi:hypothetical protein
VSSGRTFKITTKGQVGSFPLDDMTNKIGQGERTVDRWAINVINTDSTNAITVGRGGECAIPLAAGVAYRFEGVTYHDICVNDNGTSVVIAVDGSDTIAERLRPITGPPGAAPTRR